ncbi:MAG: hypothetical protein AABY04_00110 [Candidatus Micrarchaeota archaeon]
MQLGIAQEETDFTDPLKAISGNISSNIIVIPETPGPQFDRSVIPTEKLILDSAVSVSELSNVICIPPNTGQSCSCKIAVNFEPEGANLAQFRCIFLPLVSGTYLINVESDKKKAWGNFSIDMRPGEVPQVEQKLLQNSFGELIFSLIFLGMIICSYLFYFFYKILNRKRDALNKIYDERQKIEDDMKVLRYRFFKREIDATTYNSVFKQKEKELSDINDKIVATIKSKKGAIQTPASE